MTSDRESLAQALENGDERTVIALVNAAPTLEAVWTVLAVLGRELPDQATVLSMARRVRAEGAAPVVRGIARHGRIRHPRRTVELLRDPIIVDVEDTARSHLVTGIQRVVRESIRRWADRPGVVLSTWTRDLTALRELIDVERHVALSGPAPGPLRLGSADRHVQVPIGGTYVLPELAANRQRTSRIAGLVRFSGVVSTLVGHDCVPITSAETVADGMPGAFVGQLAAATWMDRIATVSSASGQEYLGWRGMLRESGVPGPDIKPISLAATTVIPSVEDVSAFSARVPDDGLPIVLVVGSHEPRKNHLAVLQAAELLWQADRRFRLVMIGGNSWSSEQYDRTVVRLMREGRPISTLRALPDGELWAAYRVARFTVFPSLNEGFGLPVIESIASSTPVITSAFGSTREIAHERGGLLVDPRSDDELLDAMRRLLDDDALLAHLRSQAAAVRVRTWDEYAEDLWSYALAPRADDAPARLAGW